MSARVTTAARALAAAPKGGYHFPHIGILGGHHPIKRTADKRVFQGRLGFRQARLRGADGGLGAGHSGLGFFVTGLSHVVVLAGNKILAHQGLGPLILQFGVVQFRLGGNQAGLGFLNLGPGLIPGRHQVLVFQTGQNLAFFDPTAFFHPQIIQAAGALGRHGRFTLGHDVPTGVQDGVGLGGVNLGDHRHRDLFGRSEGTPKIKGCQDRQGQADQKHNQAQTTGAGRTEFPGRAVNAQSIKIRRQADSPVQSERRNAPIVNRFPLEKQTNSTASGFSSP